MRTAVALLILATGHVAAPSPDPTPDRASWTMESLPTSDGITTVVIQQRRSRLPDSRPSGNPASKPPAPVWDYRWVIDCPGNTFASGDEVPTCSHAINACRNQPGPGPMGRLYRRQLSPTPSGRWIFTGYSCFPPRTGAPRPAITLNDIRTAYAHTPFRRPHLHVQPPGGRTLVRVPNYLRVTLTGTGYGPGDTRILQMLGHTVRIRLKPARYTYTYGDGTPPHHTTSPGGPYPDGDVTHTYPQPGIYPMSASITYDAEYAIDTGPWHPIDQPATLTAAATQMHVLTAHPRLVPS